MALSGAAPAAGQALDGTAERGPRRILNGVLWIDRTGAPWRDLPERYGPMGTASSRSYRWRAAGVWSRVLSALQAQADARGELEWELHFVDATVIRAHQHAAGPVMPGMGRTLRRWGVAETGGGGARCSAVQRVRRGMRPRTGARMDWPEALLGGCVAGRRRCWADAA